MPELPEVERAVGLIRSVTAGKRIVKVETAEDTIVYAGTSHDYFSKELVGRVVTHVGRYGKVFYLELDGEGKFPVLHFGMTGMLQVKGQLPTYYRKKPDKEPTQWPPRFMKFILHLHEGPDKEAIQLAFMDARRLGRIRLCSSPMTEPPICDLGFDPIISMPSLEAFQPLVSKRSCPIKALLLDQSFSAGVGNWVADEILYHSRIHPEQRCNTLTDSQIAALHYNTRNVCQVAIDVNADDTKFPDNWLFKHRWGKGKKETHDMKLPSGKPATIKWITVGGRTSAYVVELQGLPGKKEKAAASSDNGSESELTSLSESDHEQIKTLKRKAASGGDQKAKGNSQRNASKRRKKQS